MREVRIFSPEPLKANTVIELHSDAARHVGQVLRMQPGQTLVLFDGTGGSYPAVINDLSNRTLSVETGIHQPKERESPLNLTLWHGLCRGERMDSIVQKATELGANTIQPLLTERSLVKLDDRKAGKKLRHWQKIVASACEQCGRNQLPSIEKPERLPELLAKVSGFDIALVLDPQASTGLSATLENHSDATNILICTGPEGGFTDQEIKAASQAGMLKVHAGPRILRTETAPLVAISIVQALLGDMRSGS